MRIQPPTAGVDRRFAYQSQPPFTTPSASNVWPQDSLGQRYRVGSRYGLSKAIASRPASSPVLASIAKYVSTTLNIHQVLGTSVWKYASGSWSDVTGATSLGSAGSRRVVVVPTTVTNSIHIACANYSNFYNYVDGVGVAVEAIEASVSAMLHDEDNWRITPPRSWSRGVAGDTGVIQIGGSAVANDTLTGCVSWANGYAAFFTGTATIILYGDPAHGGRFITVSTRYGMLDAMSWCRGPGNSLWVMSASGLMRFDTPGFSEPAIASNERIPASLKNIDPTAYHVSLAYDSIFNGIFIYVTKVSAGDGTGHFFYKLPEGDLPGSYWPLAYHTDTEPFSLCTLSRPTPAGFTASSYTDTMLCSRSGYSYLHDPAVITDDGNAITSTLWLGPFYGWDAETEGRITTLVASLATGGGSVTWSIHAANSAEAAFAASSSFSGTWSAGTNNTDRPNIRGYAWFIKLTSTAKWGIENIVASRSKLGRFRG